MLNETQIKKLKDLYNQIFGKELTDEEAQRQGAALLRLIDLIYKPLTEGEYEQFKNKPPPPKN